MLRLRHHQPGTPARMGEYLYQRTGGMIDTLSQLIRGAAPSLRSQPVRGHYDFINDGPIG
ncbi:hypothetical protein [Streptomyces sp. NPDC048611]|uniref:hypothetical protein n=1 Tax=unclassified Streptomyces TaxID=2593676 RepID=UPI0034202F65